MSMRWSRTGLAARELGLQVGLLRVYAASDDQTAVCLDTPWSAPSPVFEKLVQLYPSLTFTLHFVEAGNDLDYVETYVA